MERERRRGVDSVQQFNVSEVTMSQVQAVRCEAHTGDDDWSTVVMAPDASNAPDYNDEVTQEDINDLHAHVKVHFGTPKFVHSSEAAW